MKTSEPDNKQLSDQHKDITELSVSELFKNGQYVIPIYQRNYAWGEPEVEQLIQDIMDVATKNKDSDYFIGSLVVYTRKNGVYETIDGQQRHTTLSIILSVLKHAYKQSLDHIDHINLGFDSRPKSDQTLRRLFKNPEQATDEPEERTIRSAYEVARRFLAQPECDVDAFTNYLLHKVKILRVVVPEDTDLNHYFEIMNNRGEQLEKHEVLKARMMKDLGDLERTAFAAIWDACADMNRYVQLGINSAYREKVFGRDWNHMPVDFDDLCSAFAESADYSKELSLAAIIEKPALKLSRPKTVSEEAGTFSTIVTFPNFLLHALRLLTEDDVPLDDKRLLESFSEYMPKDKSSGWFVIELLKIRMLFDSYIIKRENEEDWSLKSLKLYKNGKQKSFGYVNSCDDEKLNTQLIMLLSMFHVSFPAQVYKHWLNAALKYLCTTSMDNEYWTIEGKDYLAHLERLSDSFFYGRYGVNSGGEPIDYYELIYKDAKLPDEFDMDNLSLGTNVQNFLFNRLDYQLWKRLINNVPFDGVDMKYIRQRLNSFSFTFRTSVEHYYPQHPITGNKLKESDTLPNGVDSFGNLCLISRSNNSKLSNYLPKAKKDHYEKATTVESLKQIFMMSYEDWGPDCPEVIAEHESMMIEVLYGDI
ncbi:DUF262 domain-containing protein [Endozoicomonas sp. 4G]|uniref:DUF262 domain-containing protein n=1 Tax=Endozoicomonas sp. 4G TaxID=2872754 RepID=UPI002078BC28|nr:DUF262 domain-containing protein [Endozoicomonas sp. 4G]